MPASGKDSARFPTAGHYESLTWKAGWLSVPVDAFDEALFGISAREAAEMDPCQRFVCEVIHEALYDARIPVDNIRRKKVGVFVGAGIAEYMAMQFGDPDNITPYTMTGNSLAIMANRISYLLDLHGPSMTVDTACSASSTAFALAVRAIETGDCEVALVAGVNLLLSPSPFVGFSKARMLSVTGESRPFDKNGNGFVRGEGCGAVVVGKSQCLQELSVGLRMYAAVRGVCTNEDGQSQTLTEPKQEMQISLYSTLLEKSGVEKKNIGYIEAHGTGTPVGDPIEARAIVEACFILEKVTVGSIKANIGHCETAAGIAGIIKGCLTVYTQEIPPQAGFSELHPAIDGSRFRVATALETLDSEKVVLCSSYGFGGANAAVCLGKAPSLQCPQTSTPATPADTINVMTARPPVVLKIASHKETLLQEDVVAWRAWGSTNANEREEGYRLGSLLQRASSRHRHVEFSANASGKPTVLTGSAPETRNSRPLVFAFGGQGSLTDTNFGAELYATYPVFKKTIDELDTLHEKLTKRSLRGVGFCQFPGANDGQSTNLSNELEFAAPATVFFQVAMIDLLSQTFGLVPDIVLGHSLGEVAAAYASDPLWEKRSLASLVVSRTKAQKEAMQAGAMAAVNVGAEEMSALLESFFPDPDQRPEVVCLNDRSSVSIGGERAAVEECVKRMSEKGYRAKILGVDRAYHSRFVDKTTTAAFHSSLIEGFSGPCPSTQNGCKFLSTSTAMENDDSVLYDFGPGYWEANMCNPVNFVGATQQLAPNSLVLEISASPVLAGYLADLQLESVCISNAKSGSGVATCLTALGGLYVKGFEVEFNSEVSIGTNNQSKDLRIPYLSYSHQKKHRSLTWKPPHTAAAGAALQDKLASGKTGKECGVFSSIVLSRDDDRYSHYVEHLLDGEIVLPGAGTTSLLLSHMQKTVLSCIEFVGVVNLWGNSNNSETLTLSTTPHGENNTTLCEVFQGDRIVARAEFASVQDGNDVSEKVTVEGKGVPIDPKKVYESLETHAGLHLRGAFRSIVELDRVGRWGSRATVRAPREGALDVVIDGMMQTAAVLCDLGQKPMVPKGIGALRVFKSDLPREVKTLCNLKSYNAFTGDAVADIDAYAGAHGESDLLAPLNLVISLRDVTLTRYYRVLPPLTVFDIGEIQKVGFPQDDDPSTSLVEQLIRVANDRVVRVLDEANFLASVTGLPEKNVYIVIGDSEGLASKALGGFDVVVVERFLGSTAALTTLLAPGGRVYDWNAKAFADSTLDATGNTTQESDGTRIICHFGTDLRSASRALAEAKTNLMSDSTKTLVFVSLQDSDAGKSAALRGWTRSARQENLARIKIYSVTLIGVGGTCPASDVEAVWESSEATRDAVMAHVRKGLGDMELVYDIASGEFSAPRMSIVDVTGRSQDSQHSAAVRQTSYRCVVQSPGSLSSLQWRPVHKEYEVLEPNDVRVEVAAVSLHFKDLMLALGKLPGFKPTLGMECSGRVVEIGKSVTDLAIGESVAVCSLKPSLEPNRSLLATHAITTADSIVKLPEGCLRDEEDLVRVAGFLGVYATASYALEDIGRLSEDEWVLIHSAMGGVGQAALGIAKAKNANIIASAGSEEKRRRLREEFGIKHTIDSRTPSRFRAEILKITGEHNGVDIVLNSLAGEGMIESMKCLAAMGRFVEIGKVDMFNNAQLPLGLLKQNISFHSVHLDILTDSHPKRVRNLLRRCGMLFNQGATLMPETTVFDAPDIEKALRYMQTGKHTGKVLVKMATPTGTTSPPRSVLSDVAAGLPDALFDGHGTYVITGGNGGLGQFLAHWLAKKGARNLLLVSRSGSVDHKLMPEGVQVSTLAADVGGDGDELAKAFRACHPPVRGVFHLAGTFPVNAAHELHAGNVDIDAAFAAKQRGVQNLTRAVTSSGAAKLTHFVSFSSLAALLGNIDQALYTAANVAMEETTSLLREKHDLPALVVSLPIVLGAGRLAQAENLLELNINTDRFGRVTSFDELLAGIEPLLHDLDVPSKRAGIPKVILPMAGSMPKGDANFVHLPSDHIAVAPDSSQSQSPSSSRPDRVMDREAIYQDVRQKVAYILGAELDEIEPESSLTSHGMDSLAIVELATHMQREYNYTISKNDVFQGLSLAQLVEAVAGKAPVVNVASDAGKSVTVKEDSASSIDAEHPGIVKKIVNITKKIAFQPSSDSKARSTCSPGEYEDPSSTYVLSTSTSERPCSTKATLLSGVDVPVSALRGLVPVTTSQSLQTSENFRKVALATDVELSSKAATIIVPKVFDDVSLRDVIDRVRDHAGQVLILRGAELGTFCQGMDLSKFGPENLGAGLVAFSELSDLLLERTLPTICVVEGPCAGGGMLFPCVATLVIATDDASFGFPEVRRGLLPGVVSVVAQKRLQVSVCKRLMTFGDIIQAEEAMRLGLVDDVVSAEKDIVSSRLAAATRRLQSIDAEILQASVTSMPASCTEAAMVAMGGLDKRSRDRCRPDDELVSVQLDEQSGVAVVELNDAERCNAMDWALSEDLRRATKALSKLGDKVRAIVLQGAGEHFCVGVNPYSFVARCRDLPLLTQAKVTYDIYHSFVSIRSIGVPIICVVHGRVLGGGLAASLNADYRIGTIDTQFNYGNMPRGVCPGLLLSSHLTETLGFATANALYMNDDTLSAEDALSSGLIHEVAADARSAKGRALEFAALIGSYSNVGVRSTISLMRSRDDMARLARESFNMARCFTFGNSFDGQKWKRNENKPPSTWLTQVRGIQKQPSSSLEVPVTTPIGQSELTMWDYDRDVSASFMKLGTPRTTSSQRNAGSECFFLTGATGYLGINLLCDLQARGAHVVALVRADDVSSGVSRLKLAAAAQGLQLTVNQQLSVVCGSVEKPNFGLSAEDYARWTIGCDVIVHNAACIELGESYENLLEVNVGGTKNAIKFAADGVVSTLVHVSSLAVFSLHVYEGSGAEIRPDPLKLRNGYSRSKWVSEQCVWKAAELGLPVHVVRPGRIMGHSGSGCTNMKDWFSAYLHACLQMGYYWNLQHETDMTAVDDVSNLIIDCAVGLKPAYDVNDLRSRPRAYHAYSKNVLTAHDIGRILRERGWSHLQPCSFEKWVSYLKSKLAHLNFAALTSVFEEINVSATQGIHINFSSDFPMDSVIQGQLLLHKMLDWMLARGLLPQPQTEVAGLARRPSHESLTDFPTTTGTQLSGNSDSCAPSDSSEILPVKAPKKARTPDVGIHAMELYIPRFFLEQASLEKEHGCVGKYTQGLGQEQIGFCWGDEDVVSYALTAVCRLMERHSIEWSSIGRIDVGTESSVDRSKSVKSFVCDLFKEKGVTDIEGADSIHACYGGTAAFFNACAWCESKANVGGKFALVIAADIANQPEEYLFMMGTGVVAMLVGRDSPLVLASERASHSISTWDFYKPAGWKNNFPIMLDGAHSVDCYMECLDGCQQALTHKMKKTPSLSGSDQDQNILSEHDFYIFHCTSVYLCKRGFDRLVANSGQKTSIKGRAELYERKTEPGCKITKRNGSAYAASVYVCLYALMDHMRNDNCMQQKKNILVFSYGSGSLSSMYRFKKIANAPVKLGLSCDALLDRRVECSVPGFLAANAALTENYKKLDFYPESGMSETQEHGVYYLSHVDEWGKRTYKRHA